ncbi:MAG TPA: preprotein translocase subunit SecE [Candidatus Saccharimonadales bacterium]|nr:preprotein translocase subunit SecE [Candidatus Saccharimonadales bacterium]
MADNESAGRAKRRLRNPETVRERALKAQEDAGKPPRRRLVATTATNVSKPFRSAARIFRYQPFKFLSKVLRFVGRLVFPRYFRNSWRELRQVNWPNFRQTRQLVTAVLMFAIIFGALVALVDYGLDKLFREVLLK